MDNSFAYQPATERYERMQYKYCGRSGLKLPLISLGLWHNFGSVDDFTMATDMIKYAFDHGITHFDLANNYGPVPGSAETNFGRILRENFQGYRDEMIISSKAGHEMWAGPYGGNSSRKNLMASIDQSLRRTGLEYFDIFYTHRYDGVTPVEETIQALIDIVKRGKALYIGISKYPPEQARIAYEMLAKAGVPCLISQYRRHSFISQYPCQRHFSQRLPTAMGYFIQLPGSFYFLRCHLRALQETGRTGSSRMFRDTIQVFVRQ